MKANQNAFERYQKKRQSHWDDIALRMDDSKSMGSYYHRRLEQVYRFLVHPGQKILEIGCGQGDLLASLSPQIGVGIDFSINMINRASQRYPQLRFINIDAYDLDLNDTFDAIILSDIVNDLWDVQTVFEKIAKHTTPETRIILNLYSHLWEQPLTLVQKLGLATPTLPQNWLTVEDICNLFYLTGFEIIRHWEEVLWPLDTPVLSSFFNRYVAKLWPFKKLALTNFILARPSPREAEMNKEKSVSVIVPARNEAGNIESILERTPKMGRETEIIFVEGHSKDNTYETIEKAIANISLHKCKLFRQTGKGKGDAVRLGFEKASGDILMILDADMTVPPEDLPRFYEALRYGKAEFVNGVRLVYPMEKQAMRFFNLLGNKFFSIAFCWLLGQPLKDSLCGTKALTKVNYNKIVENRSYFGDFDPFGDFDLIFGAAKLNLRIVDMPIRYRERVYGETQISRWRHGWLLLKMVVFAAWRIKFV